MTQSRHAEPLPLGDNGLPYSKGLMARALITTGLSTERAYELARRIELDLDQRAMRSIELDRVQELAVEVLGVEDGTAAIGRLRRFGDLQKLELPIILLVGGSTGTGKSTVATEAAYRLGITRVTSTDFVRGTMRAFFSEEFMPAIHHSSFEAGVRLRDAGREDAPDYVVRGFLEQTRNVLVGVRASMDRALQEGWSMVLEGVHLVPGMLPRAIEGALVVQCVLAVEDEQEHAGHFFVRDAASDGVRALDKYLEGLGEIRQIQDFIVERARKLGVPVIENEDMERTLGEVMELVLEGAERVQRVEA